MQSKHWVSEKFQVTKEKNDKYLITFSEDLTVRISHRMYYILQMLNNPCTTRQLHKKLQKSNSKLFKNKSIDDVERYLYSLQKARLITSSKKIHQKHTTCKWFNPTKALTKIFFFMGLISLSIIIFSIYKYPLLSIPQKQDFFISNFLSVNIIISLILGSIFAMGHEFAHAFVGSAMGLHKISFSISHRLYFIIFLTKFDDIYTVKEKHRIPIYMAGLCFDAIIVAFTLTLLIMQSSGILIISSFMVAVLKQIILLQFFSFIWECMLFLRTDFYYLITDLLDLENFKFSLRNIKLRNNKHRALLIVFVVGNGLALLNFAFILLPIKFENISQGITNIMLPNITYKVDGLLTLILESAYILIFAFIFFSSSRKIMSTFKKNISFLMKRNQNYTTFLP